ncbi:MAG: ABC transporter ATP-binding protein [Candidatus Pacebacteria bacterium]|nr:ABC transporter ATP-binding protein [Candidatus Paceibacterota bacterium]
MNSSQSNNSAQVKAPWLDPTIKPLVRVEGVRKQFGDFVAVDGVDLSIYKGEFFSLLGASGCGKTTLLRMMAGFEKPSSGRIYIDGVDMATIPAYNRPVNMMFQSYALFPHMSVASNVAFGLKQDRVKSAEIKKRVAEILELVQLSPMAKRKPNQLSGGQRQRVALARALVKRPKLLLLDEPLSALDRKLREQTQFELVNIQQQLGVTFVIVTHDQEEAMTMSGRIAVMNAGRIIQLGTPSEVYEFPNSRFVSSFIGQVNLFEGVLAVDEPSHCEISCPSEKIMIRIGHGVTGTVGMKLAVAVRPEKMIVQRYSAVASDPEKQPNHLVGTVSEIAYQGDVSILHVHHKSGKVLRVTIPNIDHHAENQITWDEKVVVSFKPSSAVVLQQ